MHGIGTTCIDEESKSIGTSETVNQLMLSRKRGHSCAVYPIYLVLDLVKPKRWSVKSTKSRGMDRDRPFLAEIDAIDYL